MSGSTAGGRSERWELRVTRGGVQTRYFPWKVTPIWGLEIHEEGKRSGAFGLMSTTIAADDPKTTPEYAWLSRAVALNNAAAAGVQQKGGKR